MADGFVCDITGKASAGRGVQTIEVDAGKVWLHVTVLRKGAAGQATECGVICDAEAAKIRKSLEA